MFFVHGSVIGNEPVWAGGLAEVMAKPNGADTWAALHGECEFHVWHEVRADLSVRPVLLNYKVGGVNVARGRDL